MRETNLDQARTWERRPKRVQQTWVQRTILREHLGKMRSIIPVVWPIFGVPFLESHFFCYLYSSIKWLAFGGSTPRRGQSCCRFSSISEKKQYRSFPSYSTGPAVLTHICPHVGSPISCGMEKHYLMRCSAAVAFPIHICSQRGSPPVVPCVTMSPVPAYLSTFTRTVHFH